MKRTNHNHEDDRASTLQDLFDLLPGDVRREGDGWVTNCPNRKGHKNNDARPSLRISVADNGTVLVKCRAGCETSDVMAAVGLTLYDLATMQPGDVGPRLRAATPPGEDDLRALQRYLDATAARLRDPHDPDAARALDYAHRRFGLDEERALDLGLGVDTRWRCPRFRASGPLIPAGAPARCPIGVSTASRGACRAGRWATTS